MLILFAKNLVLQIDRRDPLRENPFMRRMYSKHSSEDRKDFNVEQAHERTGRPVITHDVINVSDGSQACSAHESETFNVGDETLRERMERSEKRTTTFRCEACAEYQRSRIDLN